MPAVKDVELSELTRIVRRFYARKLRRPLVSHGPLERLGAFARDPRLAGVESIVEAVPAVHTIPSFPAGTIPFDVDYGGGIPVSKASAYPLHHAGNTLVVKAVGPSIPSLTAAWRELADALGIAAMPTIFMSPKNVGTPTHFDAAESLAIQIRGTKRWWVSPNLDVAPPVTWASALVYDQRPKRAITLHPGSVLILPAGTWHSTEGVEDSISVSAFLILPTWLEVLQKELGAAAPAAWNQPALPRIVGGPDGERQVRRRVAELLREAAARPANGEGRSAEPAVVRSPRRMAPPPRVPAQLERVPGSRARLQRRRGYFITGDLVAVSPRGRKTTIAIPAELWETARTILATDPLDVGALHARMTGTGLVSHAAFARLLEALIEARVLRR